MAGGFNVLTNWCCVGFHTVLKTEANGHEQD